MEFCECNIMFSLFQLFGFLCDKRKHQAAVVVLIAAMSVQGIGNLQVQFVSVLFLRSLSSVKLITCITGVHLPGMRRFKDVRAKIFQH